MIHQHQVVRIVAKRIAVVVDERSRAVAGDDARIPFQNLDAALKQLR